MLSLLFAIALSAIPGTRPGRAGAVLRCNGKQRTCSQQGFGRIGNYLAADGSYQTASDVCSLFASELTTPSFCLRGDGTSTGSLSLSAVGSPTTQTMAWCENGLGCGPVSRQLVSATSYFQTASMAQPSGSWWYCTRGIADAPLVASRYGGQTNSWGLSVTSTGVAQLSVTGGTTLASGTGVIVGGASQVVCASWHQAGAGANVATLYVDGVQQAQNTTEPNLAAVSTPISSGDFGAASSISRLGFAMFGLGDPNATLFSRLASATAPTPQGTRGEPISETRPSPSWVSASDGSLTALQTNRLGVSGGVVSSPSRTNLLTFSEQLNQTGQWATGTTTVTADQAAGPDGANTADKLTPAGAGSNVRSGPISVTANGGAYTASIYVKQVSAAGTSLLYIWDTTAGAAICSKTVTLAAAWQRATCAVASTTSGHSIYLGLQPDNVSGTNPIYAVAAQLETGSIATPYCRSEGTSSTCSGDQVTVPTPSGLSLKEGCARACITSAITGSNPSAGSINYLTDITSTRGWFLYTPPSPAGDIRAFDGTHNPLVAANWVAGSKVCAVTRWSASAGTLTITNLTTGATNTVTGFTGWPGSFGTIQIGGNGTGSQPYGAAISDIQFGSSPGACN